jgi:homoserine O-acetyltransferase
MIAEVVPFERIESPLVIDEAFELESGELLPRLEIAFETWGSLNAAGDNAVYICHALTGDAHAGSSGSAGSVRPGWWEGLIGSGRALDPENHYIVCANLLGSCYGTTGPASIDPRTEDLYAMTFPQVTTRDMIRVHRLLLDALGVTRLELVIGGSLGGMQVWQWLVDEPDYIANAVPIAGSLQGSPWVIALNQVARQAIYNDPAWQLGRYNGRGPSSGLALARMIAMISYRSDRQFWQRFGRDLAEPGTGELPEPGANFQVESYLDHQGQKLVERFDARSYVYLTRAMDLHDVARGSASLDEALARIRSRVMAIGIDSDVLYYPHEMRAAVERLIGLRKAASYREIQSPYGHDAFLVEYDQLNAMVRDFLEGGRS